MIFSLSKIKSNINKYHLLKERIEPKKRESPSVYNKREVICILYILYIRYIYIVSFDPGY